MVACRDAIWEFLRKNDMPKNESGYVYILTNPSFREDWVKIGKSCRPVDIRSKELDNTAVPLPFDIYATLKTNKFNETEKLVHSFIDQLTTRRIRKTREFFNLRPEEALQIFQNVYNFLDTAELSLYKDNKVYQTFTKSPEAEHVIEAAPEKPENEIPPTERNVWLIPFNKKYFDLKGCLNKYGQVYWSRKCNFHEGDTVYIYSSKPDGKISYCMSVAQAIVPASEEGNEFRKESSSSFEETEENALLRPAFATDSKKLTLEAMKEHGLKTAPLGPIRLSQEKYSALLDFIQHHTKPLETEVKLPKRPNFRFSMCDIVPGETVTFVPLNLEVTVADDMKVEYKGEKYRLSSFVKAFLPDSQRTPSNSYQGSLFFSYKGEILEDIRKRNDPKL